MSGPFAEFDAPDDCGCFACIGSKPTYEGAWLTIGMSRMIVCATCGNKRCPHGTDHRHACTGSNEPGQDGSRYGTAIARTNPAAPTHSDPVSPSAYDWPDIDVAGEEIERRHEEWWS